MQSLETLPPPHLENRADHTVAIRPEQSHVWAFLLGLVCMGVLLVYQTERMRQMERMAIHWVAQEAAEYTTEKNTEPRLEKITNFGMALQRQAMAEADLLPFYGSSELAKPVEDRASAFFKNSPTGFEVFPVGKAGTTSLVILQKIAACAGNNEGRKVAILLSPGWFFSVTTEGRFYEGNFSRQQASALVFNPRLSIDLKQAIARRMQARPATLERNALLQFASARLADGSTGSRLLYHFTEPLGFVQNWIYSLQDDAEVAANLSVQRDQWMAPMAKTPAVLNWDELLASADRESQDSEDFEHRWRGHRREINTSFRETMLQSTEWGDLDLLLETLDQLRLDPLILCMPPNGDYLQRQGVARQTLDLFEQRLREHVGRHGMRLVAFEDHIDDRRFLADHHDHLSAKGWMYINQALDEFFHGKEPQLKAQIPGDRT